MLFFFSYFICCILFIRHKAVDPVRIQGQGLTQACEYYEAGVIETLWLPTTPSNIPELGSVSLLSRDFHCPSQPGFTISSSLGAHSIDSLTSGFWKQSWEKFSIFSPISRIHLFFKKNKTKPYSFSDFKSETNLQCLAFSVGGTCQS